MVSTSPADSETCVVSEVLRDSTRFGGAVPESQYPFQVPEFPSGSGCATVTGAGHDESAHLVLGQTIGGRGCDTN